MTRLSPPFLEVNFYFAETPDSTAFVRVLGALAEEGAQFAGLGAIHRGPGIGRRPFAGTHEDLLESVPLHNVAEAETYATAADTRLIQVAMIAAASSVRGGGEIVTYVSISPEAAASDHHPIAIYTTGTLFSGPQDKAQQRQRKQLGARVYKRFLNLIRQLEPSYAAVTVEWSLECPADLRRDPRSMAFRDFYVSTSYLGARRSAQVLDLFPEAYREAVADGWYVSCAKDFNPAGRQIDWGVASAASNQVAAIIATTRRDGKYRA